VVVVPDKQGYACESYDEFEGYDKDVLHNGNGLMTFILWTLTVSAPNLSAISSAIA
jgi:hypothetical protein